MLGRVLWGFVGLLVLALFSSGFWIFMKKPLHSRKHERHAARFIAESKTALRFHGGCPSKEELERLSNGSLCPVSELCLYYEPATCAVGYYVSDDDYFEYRVREERWYSSEELMQVSRSE